MTLDPRRANTFHTALQAAGMPPVPGEFSVVPQHQVIPASILAEISDFIRAFDRVTGRHGLAGGGLARGAGDCAAEKAGSLLLQRLGFSSSARGRLPAHRVQR